MKTFKISLLLLLVLITSSKLVAQEAKTDDSPLIDLKQLPEYVVITSENTKLLGGIDITIDSKKSKYEKTLSELESLLQSGKKLKIRNQTDLFNAMSKIGYEYVDSYNATSGTLGAGTGKDVEVFGSESKFRINTVFRKKSKYRE